MFVRKQALAEALRWMRSWLSKTLEFPVVCYHISFGIGLEICAYKSLFSTQPSVCGHGDEEVPVAVSFRLSPCLVVLCLRSYTKFLAVVH